MFPVDLGEKETWERKSGEVGENINYQRQTKILNVVNMTGRSPAVCRQSHMNWLDLQPCYVNVTEQSETRHDPGRNYDIMCKRVLIKNSYRSTELKILFKM